MTREHTTESLLDVARKTIEEAGSASLVTLNESDEPSSRAAAAFAPDEDFSRIVIGTHPDSRKTAHVLKNPKVLLSYVDMSNRGYLTVIGNALIDVGAIPKTDY